jgi:hypothetical protein
VNLPSLAQSACGFLPASAVATGAADRRFNVAHGAADGVADSVQPNSYSLRRPPRRRPGRWFATAAESQRASRARVAARRSAPPVPQRTVRAAGRAHMERQARTRTVRGTVLAWRAAGPLARRGLQGRAPQGSWPRAQRASTSDSAHVSERSGRRPRSELCAGPRDRGAEGSLRRRRRPRNLSAVGCPHGPLLARTPAFHASRISPSSVGQPKESRTSPPR